MEKPWLSFSLCICHHFDPFGQHSNLPDGSTLCYFNPGEFYLPILMIFRSVKLMTLFTDVLRK